MRSERGVLNHYKKRKPAYSNKDSGQSVQFSSVVSDFLHLHGLQHIRPPCPSPTPRACSNLMSMELVMPSNHLILSSPSPPALNLSQYQGLFPMSQFFASGGQSIGVSASVSVLPMNIQNWSPLGWTGWISLKSKGLSTLLQHHSSKASILWPSAFFIVQVSHPYVTTEETIALTRQTFVGKIMSLLFNILSRLIIAFLPRSKHLLICGFLN